MTYNICGCFIESTFNDMSTKRDDLTNLAKTYILANIRLKKLKTFPLTMIIKNNVEKLEQM